jgi:polysaccharide pyruvyl transferase WcaK-like protein
VRFAQDAGVTTACYAVGAGPLERPADRASVAAALNEMQLVTVREKAAKRLLEESGLECEITVTADPALLLEPEPFTQQMLEREGLSDGQRLIGMSVREAGSAMSEMQAGEYHALLANAADFMAERFEAQIVFVPLEHQDIREAHRVIGRMALPEHAWVLKRSYGPRELCGLMEHLDMAVGMRLHFLLFAVTAGVPVAALPYASKVNGFLESLDLRSPDPERSAHAGALLSHIDRLWDGRDEQIEHVRERLPSLQEAARENVRLIVGLLDRHAPAAAS